LSKHTGSYDNKGNRLFFWKGEIEHAPPHPLPVL
jgi:hypothetical protein